MTASRFLLGAIVLILVTVIAVSLRQNVNRPLTPSPSVQMPLSTITTTTAAAPLLLEASGAAELSVRSNRILSITNGLRHSIPLDQVLEGGPGKDGIPAIDQPKFTSTVTAQTWLGDDAPGLALSFRGRERFYPFAILVWHEIVNDTVNRQRLLITYCPLCRTAIVFDPVVQGQRVEFGVSGKLWNSNLLMYDRKTDTLWSQVLGEAVVGPLTGAVLRVLPSDLIQFGTWRRLHPNGEVLSRETGSARPYGNDPYGDYYSSNSIMFPVAQQDKRLEPKAFVLGIVLEGKAKAYLVTAIKAQGTVNDIFQGRQLVIRYEPALETVHLYEKQSGGKLLRLTPIPAFWFSWVAVHPETELYPIIKKSRSLTP